MQRKHLNVYHFKTVNEIMHIYMNVGKLSYIFIYLLQISDIQTFAKTNIPLMCLSIGTPKNNKFSICSKWKIHYF